MRYQAVLRCPPGVVLGLVVTLCGIGGRSTSALAQAAPPKKILFASNRDNKAFLNLYSMNADGSGQTRLGKSDTLDFDPIWSPDGKQIVFVSFANLQDKKTQISLMNADGSQRKTIASLDDMAFSPAWSPDGKHIAFASTGGQATGSGSPKFVLHIMDADGKNRKDLGEGIPSAWSQDGKSLLFAKYVKKGNDVKPFLYTMDGDGSNAKSLGDTEAVMGTWSPDGKRIAYMGTEMGSAPNIYVMNADGSAKTRLSDPMSIDFGPQWSADGKHILFTQVMPSDESPDLNMAELGICSMDTDGKNVKPLTTSGVKNLLCGSGFFLLLLRSESQAAK